MILTRSDIEHLAALARLHVSDEEAERLSHDLTEIVEFIDRASDREESGHTPMTRPDTDEGVVRDDVPETDGVGEAAEQAARTEDGYVRVPPVRGMSGSAAGSATRDATGEAAGATTDPGDDHSDSRGGSIE